MKIAGIILIAVAAFCILVGRINYEIVAPICRDMQECQAENPIAWALFGAPLTEEVRSQLASAGSFAYSFTPPLCLVEVVIYAGLIVGVVLTWAGSRRKPTGKATAGDDAET